MDDKDLAFGKKINQFSEFSYRSSYRRVNTNLEFTLPSCVGTGGPRAVGGGERPQCGQPAV